MSDTCALFAETAEKTLRGDEVYVSPRLAHAAQRCATAGDVRGRRLYLDSLAAFRSNLMDAADLGPGVRDELLAFLRGMDAIAPTSASLDAAMARKAQQ